jgi:regulator of nucleoside diphosphate kinase
MTTHTPVLNERDFDRLNELVTTARRTHGPLAAALGDGLGRSKPVAPARVPKSVVTMNSRVELSRGPADDPSDSATCTLVYPDQERAGEGRVSVLTPLGTALLGARVGEEVYWPSTDGPRTAKVRQLVYQPEAAGDLSL